MDALKELRKKSWAAYVPWTAIGCFILVTVGMIIWAVGTQTAFTNTTSLLHQLQINADSSLNTVHSAGIAAVVLCMLTALIMVFMALGRTSLEKKIDEQGKVACGTWLWLAVLAVLATVWWIIVFFFVFVIFGSVGWYAATFTIEGALSAVLSAIAAAPGPLPISGNSTACPSTCFNLAYFSHFISYVQDVCICDQRSLQSAYNSADAAANALHLTVAGSFVMWVGTSFLLMVAVGSFAATRRERDLILRAQRNVVTHANPNMAENPLYYRDTQPLLGVQMGGGQHPGGQPAMVMMQPAAGPQIVLPHPSAAPPGMMMAGAMAAAAAPAASAPR